MTPGAVLFDCDGVIVDSEPVTNALIAESLARHGLPLTIAEVMSLFVGGTMPGVARRARAMGASLPDDWVETIYEEIYARLAEGTPLIPGIPALLDRLDAARIPYAVGSNGTRRKMQVTLGQHPSLHARFAGRLFSREDVEAPKPAPDLYLHSAGALGVAPAACVVIEDSATGARAARVAGMACFGYAPHDSGAFLMAEGAVPFGHMDDLPALLGL